MGKLNSQTGLTPTGKKVVWLFKCIPNVLVTVGTSVGVRLVDNRNIIDPLFVNSQFTIVPTISSGSSV